MMGRGAEHHKSMLRDQAGRPLAGQLVEIAGCETYVVDAGAGPPVLLLHGYGDSSDSWRRVVPSLLRRHRVVAIDLPAFGRSATPADDLIDHYATFFPALSRTLGVERASLVGHSLGGAVALRVALEQPQLVDRLALIAPAGLGETPPWWWRAIAGSPIDWRAMLALPNPFAKSLIRGGLRSFLRQRLVYDPRQLEGLVEEFVDKHGGQRELLSLIKTGRSLIRGYDGTLLERASEELRMPTTVIWGSEDRMAEPAHGPAFASAVPHAVVHMLERCGHYPQMELPSQINRLLLDALRASKCKTRERQRGANATRRALRTAA